MNIQDLLNPKVAVIPMQHYEPPKYMRTAVTELPEIRFDLSGTGTYGVCLREARLACTEGRFLGAEDSALALVGQREAIKLVIHWPGYPDYEYEKKIEISTRQGVLTRAMLGEQVAKKVIDTIAILMRFAERPADRRWQVREDRVNISNVYLTSISNIYEGYWKVDLCTTYFPSRRRQIQ